jgi:DUF2075 family protein
MANDVESGRLHKKRMVFFQYIKNGINVVCITKGVSLLYTFFELSKTRTQFFSSLKKNNRVRQHFAFKLIKREG